MKPSRRTSLALLLSVALHAGLLLWALQQPLPPPPAPPPEAAASLAWVDVEVIPSPADPVATTQPPRQQPPAPTAAVRPPRPAPAEPSAPRGEVPEAPSPPASGQPAEAAPGEPAGGAQEESLAVSPEGPGLFPVIPGVGGARANPYASQSRGKTLRNGEGEGPDPEALAQMNAEKARRRVQGFALDELAAARVRGGIVDGYFGDMKKALQRTTENPPKFTEGATFVHDLVEAWSSGATQWAKTGNPYAEGMDGEGSAERDAQNPVQQRVDGRQVGPGSIEAEFLAKQQAAARLREFADGRFGSGIIALVEIHQQRDGALQGVALVRSSGNRLFDKHVLTTAPLAIAELEAAPRQGQGIHADGIRTLWAFEGRIRFKRKVDPKTLTGKDWAGIAGQNLLSGLTNGYFPGATGNFDETTGELEIVDLTNPRFTCTPRLLRIY